MILDEWKTSEINKSILEVPPLWRWLFHMGAGSSIPLLGVFLSRDSMVVLLGVMAGVVVLLELARFAFPSLNTALVRCLLPLLKSAEEREVTGATYMILAALLAFIVFDRHVAVLALFFLSLGDPMAAFVGGRVRGIRLFGKSPLGSFAFVVVGLATAGAFSMGDLVAFQWALVVGVIIAAFVEFLPFPLDDNVTVPLISGGAMTLLGV